MHISELLNGGSNKSTTRIDYNEMVDTATEIEWSVYADMITPDIVSDEVAEMMTMDEARIFMYGFIATRSYDEQNSADREVESQMIERYGSKDYGEYQGLKALS